MRWVGVASVSGMLIRPEPPSTMESYPSVVPSWDLSSVVLAASRSSASLVLSFSDGLARGASDSVTGSAVGLSEDGVCGSSATGDGSTSGDSEASSDGSAASNGSIEGRGSAASVGSAAKDGSADDDAAVVPTVETVSCATAPAGAGGAASTEDEEGSAASPRGMATDAASIRTPFDDTDEGFAVVEFPLLAVATFPALVSPGRSVQVLLDRLD